MQTTLEETDKHTVKLTIEVPPEEFSKDLDRAYRAIGNQVRIPGFRKGKVPKPIIDAQVGKEAVLEQFVEESVPTYYRTAVREHDLAPITDPDIAVEQVEEGKAFIFTATMEVRPRLDLLDYRGVEVERPEARASDTDIDGVVDRLRDRFAELEGVAHPVRAGDYVVGDFKTTIHGEELPEATRDDYLYEVGAGHFGEKVDKELEGKRAGEILKVNDTIPEGSGEHGGEEVTVLVLIKEIKAKKRPEADDEFAKTASEFDTLAELREDLRKKIEENKQREADGVVRDRVLAVLVDRVDVDLPETLVDDEIEHRVHAARDRAAQIGLTLEQLLETQGFDELRFRADARTHAIRGIKADLVLEAVARQEGLEVSAEELGREVAVLASGLDRDPKELAKHLDRTGQIVALAGDIIRSKALDLLVEHAKIASETASEPESAAPQEDPAEEPTPQEPSEEASPSSDRPAEEGS